jgi:hypothetical protein
VPSSVLGLQFRVSKDRPESEARPGGSQKRAEIRAQWEAPLRSPWPGTLGPGRFSLQWASAWQKDATGYSPLLDNNAIRQITRHGVQAEAAFALGGGLSLVASGEASRQKSSLAAFTASQKAIYLGLRWELM